MTGIFVPWLADAARLTGYPVVEVSGWRSRGVGGGGLSSVEGVLCHHTAGPSVGEAPSLRVVRDGRAGLSGPLSHYVLGRSGSPYVVAAGRCNHAGESAWDGIAGLNSRFVGIEAEDDGDGQWTDEQRDAYPRLVAACLYYMRRGSSRCAAHREVAIPRGRKIDPAGWDMDALRGHISWLLEDPLARIPRGAIAPTSVPAPPPPDAGVAPPFPLPPGYYYGPLHGPQESVSNIFRPNPEWRAGLRTWQERMADRGWTITADGMYGPQTADVCCRFQGEKRLTVDGLIGPATWRAAWSAPVT